MNPHDYGQESRPTESAAGQPPLATLGENQPAPKKRGRKWAVIMAIVLLVLAAAAGGFWYASQRKDPAPTPAPATSTPAPIALDNSDDSADTSTAGTTNYLATQSNLNLSFDYPSSWTVSPKSGVSSGSDPITITSPQTSVTTIDGAKVMGKVVVSVRAAGGTITELVAASAAQDSTQIGYKKPTATQRQYPYLTYVHYGAASKTAGAFEATMLTGGQQFKKGDVVSADILGTIDPLIAANFYECKTDSCPPQGGGTLSISDSIWQNATIFRQTEALFTSFKLN